MHWILQEGFLSETGWQALIATLTRFGIPYSVHAVAPKTGELLPSPILEHKNAICIGSYSMRHVASRNGWWPGVFDLYAQDFEQQRLHWGAHMLNYRSVVSTIAQARFSGEQMFVRPIQDSKVFSGKVFSSAAFHAWQSAICDPHTSRTDSLTPQTEIQLSKPVEIYAEYRFWIVKGEIITQSLYKRGNQVFYTSDVDERVAAFVRARILEWSPHEAFVIDACDTADGIRIVEINTLNSSGFYAADVQRLVLALEAAYAQ